MADFRFTDHGTIFLVRPLTKRAGLFLRSGRVEAEPWQWMGTALAVDHRMAEDLGAAIEAEGFQMEVEG